MFFIRGSSWLNQKRTVRMYLGFPTAASHYVGHGQLGVHTNDVGPHRAVQMLLKQPRGRNVNKKWRSRDINEASISRYIKYIEIQLRSQLPQNIHTDFIRCAKKIDPVWLGWIRFSLGRSKESQSAAWPWKPCQWSNHTQQRPVVFSHHWGNRHTALGTQTLEANASDAGAGR